MKFYHKLIVLLISIVTLGGVVCLGQSMPTITVVINGQGLTIGTPANKSLGGSFSNSTEITFSDYFWIEDLRASKNGHYTSIQGTVYGSDGEIVTGAKVEFKSNSDNIIPIGGVADNADFNRNMTSYTDITNPALLFYRNDNSSHSGYLNKYGFKPSIKVTVPSHGTYTVRLSYTLYDMPTNIIP